MELVEFKPFDQETQSFPFPSDEKKVLVIPKDLTRGQAKALGRMMREAGEQEWDDFFEMVLSYVVTLPGARWNLSTNGQQVPLTAETLESHVGMNDYAALALQVSQHYYPGMFEPEKAGGEAKDDDDLMDGLEAEDGTPAAEGDSDPNSQTPAA